MGLIIKMKSCISNSQQHKLNEIILDRTPGTGTNFHNMRSKVTNTRYSDAKGHSVTLTVIQPDINNVFNFLYVPINVCTKKLSCFDLAYHEENHNLQTLHWHLQKMPGLSVDALKFHHISGSGPLQAWSASASIQRTQASAKNESKKV